MISLICVYNNKEVLDKYLLETLKTQTVEYELILINNINNKYDSASNALNYGGKKATGKYLMFVHQDVKLKSEKWLNNVEMSLDSLENLGIVGVAGVSERFDGIISNIKHGNPPRAAGTIQINHPVEAQTLDECLFIIPRSIFDKCQLNEDIKGWHLYAVDYCLNIKKTSLKVYIIPNLIYHRSYEFKIALPKDYYKILKKILEYHRNEYKKIHTTCGIWNTSYPLFLQRINLSIKLLLGKIYFTFQS